jgi:hypothetical protein
MRIPTNISYEEFLKLVDRYHKSLPNFKYGQMYFNILTSVKPMLADTLKGSIHDPSLKDQVSENTHKLVSSKWES